MRKYKCPYCDFRADRDKLVDHVEDKHEDLIPHGFSPTRVVFNSINNKENGSCAVCKKPTEWNENAGKYNRLCNDPKCKEDLRKQYEKNMIKVYNKTTLLDDAEHQQKMLANRSISGKYTFRDGGKVTYTGSYEKKALEFFDKVLNVSSKDIMAPGPVFEYKFGGKTLKWITDIIYLPYNLVIEVKDGGNNPNNRNMEEYRDKQVAKEKMITNLGTYNYLRLTNNSFDQLLEVLAELKSKVLDDDDTEKVIRINEIGCPGGIVGMKPAAYVVPYGYRNDFSGDIEGFALSNDIISDNILTVDNEGNIKKESYAFLDDRKFSVYKFKGNIDNYKNILEKAESLKDLDKSFFYEELSGNDLLSADQIEFDDAFEEVNIDNIISRTTTLASTIIQEYHEINGDLLYMPIMNQKDILVAESLLKGHDNLTVLEDSNGYFVKDEITGYRTVSYQNIKDINIEGVLINGVRER